MTSTLLAQIPNPNQIVFTAFEQLCNAIERELARYGYNAEYSTLKDQTFNGLATSMGAMVVGGFDEYHGYDLEQVVLVVQIAPKNRRIWIGDGCYQDYYSYEPEVVLANGIAAALDIIQMQS